MQLASLTYYPA